MTGRFDAFVMFAEMRTGSNRLEESLNALEDVSSFGEVFNPNFIGTQTGKSLFGIDMAARHADPMRLLGTLVARPGLGGFRFFHDHDPRVLDGILDDPRIAKLILTRNPLDSYVSLAIASRTGQWRLSTAKTARTSRATFVASDFDALVDRQRSFRSHVHRRLQATGQTAFWISYDDIGDIDLLNGVAAFLGSSSRLEEVPRGLLRQNPGKIEEKVVNPQEMLAHLATLGRFDGSDMAQVETPRGPAAPTFMAGRHSALLALPIPGGPVAELRRWLTALDGAAPYEGLTQKLLRPWMRRSENFVSFAVIRHPLARAHVAFRSMLTQSGPEADTLRRVLTDHHGVNLAATPAEVFLAFLKFLKCNLNGQSSLLVAPGWASQSSLLAGMAQVVPPQRLIRERDVSDGLSRLAAANDKPGPPFDLPDRAELAGIVTEEIERACRQAYRRDYDVFGFGGWTSA